MTNNSDDHQDGWIHIAELTARIVAAYVGNASNRVEEEKLPGLITKINDALTPKQARRKRPSEMRAEEREVIKVQKATQPPKVERAKSVTHQYIWCLECGSAFKNIGIHARKFHNMSMTEYIYRWDLPADYPVYSEAFKQEEAKRKAQEAKDLLEATVEINKRIAALEERQSVYKPDGGDERLHVDDK